jgi:hypothetical protein
MHIAKTPTLYYNTPNEDPEKYRFSHT